MRKILASMVVMSLCGIAFAGGTAGYAIVPQVVGTDPIEPSYDIAAHQVVDFTVSVDSGDRWTTASCDATFAGNGCNFTFWEHLAGGDIQPSDLFLGLYGYLKYDSFWTCSEEYPNTNIDPDLQATTFAPGNPQFKTATRRMAEWYADPEAPNVFEGTYTLARYNLNLAECPPGTVNYETPYGVACSLELSGSLFFESTGGQAHPFAVSVPLCWNIPEPASLSLLALGGLALIRRR